MPAGVGPSTAPALVTEASVPRRMALCALWACPRLAQWFPLTPWRELWRPWTSGEEGVPAAPRSMLSGPRALPSHPAAPAALPSCWRCTLGKLGVQPPRVGSETPLSPESLWPLVADGWSWPHLAAIRGSGFLGPLKCKGERPANPPQIPCVKQSSPNLRLMVP